MRVHFPVSGKLVLERTVMRPVAGWFDPAPAKACKQLMYPPLPISATISFSDGTTTTAVFLDFPVYDARLLHSIRCTLEDDI
jgi:hypothetical protein